MQPSDFSPAAPGRVVKVHTGFWAYLPNPLPPPPDVTPRAAQLNVDKLVGAGVLHEASGRRRNRIFVAREIVATLEQVFTQ